MKRKRLLVELPLHRDIRLGYAWMLVMLISCASWFIAGCALLLNYKRLSRKPLIFKSFSSLEVSEFDELFAKIKEAYPAYEQKRLYRADRKRKVGAGHPFKLLLKNRLLMFLMYYRLYVTSTLLSFLFDLGQTNVLKNIYA